MDLTSVNSIKELLLSHHARPSKTMGQNFLIDKNILKKIIEAADIKPENTVLEIGPGIGTLTQALAQAANKVVAIEKDAKMMEILRQTLVEHKNVEITQGDILEMTNAQTPMTIGNYKLVANLPYYITSPIIRLFLEAKNPPQSMVLMVQKEVAQRIVAQPPNMSLLAVSVQYYAAASIVSPVSRACFWPVPNVDSAIIKIVPRVSASNSASFRDTFFKIVKAGFAHPRKQLANNLAQGLGKTRQEASDWLSKNNLNPSQRAETLKVQDWINLANSLSI